MSAHGLSCFAVCNHFRRVKSWSKYNVVEGRWIKVHVMCGELLNAVDCIALRVNCFSNADLTVAEFIEVQTNPYIPIRRLRTGGRIINDGKL